MALNPHTEEYYKKFIELQENLRKSEEERLELEMKFNEMVRITKEETQMHYRKLRAHYKKFLDEDRRRQDRNDRILQNLELVEQRLAMITAKTERFKLLRQQYRAMLGRIYKPKFDRSNQTPKQLEQTLKFDHFDDYRKNTSTQLDDKKIVKTVDYGRNDDLSSFGDEEYRPDFASSIADEIVKTIDKFNKNNTNNDRRIVEKNPEIRIEQLPRESIGNRTDDDEFSDKLDNDLEKSRIDDLPEVEQIQNKLDDLEIGNVEQQMQNYKFNDGAIGKSEQIDTLPVEKINSRREELQDDKSAELEPTEINETHENCEPSGEETQSNIAESTPETEQIDANIKTLINDNKGNIEIEELHDKSDDKEILEPLVTEIEENIGDDKAVSEALVVDKVENIETVALHRDEFSLDKQDDKTISGDNNENIEVEEPQLENNAESEQLLQDISKQPEIPVESAQFAITTEAETNQSYAEYQTEPQLKNNTESEQLQNLSKQPEIPVESATIAQFAITTEGETDQSYAEYQTEPQYEPAQYDENGQLVPQFDEHGQLLSQYDENGQLIPQYDQNGLLIPQFDENGQLIPQYDQNGQLIPQYDQYGQIMAQYDEHGQIIPQYDENGQLIQDYDQQYYNQQYENYPEGEQYENKEETVEENVVNEGKSPEIIEETPKIAENQELNVEENKEIGKSKPNVLEMLDTDTESVKQETKISNDSDFDFSNS